MKKIILIFISSVILNITLICIISYKNKRIETLKQENASYAWYVNCAERMVSHYAYWVKNANTLNFFATNDGRRYFEAREVVANNGLMPYRSFEIEEMKRLCRDSDVDY